jgi:hypothetical protein
MLGLLITIAGWTESAYRPPEGQQSFAHDNRQTQFLSPGEVGLAALPLGLPLEQILEIIHQKSAP